MDLSAQWAFLRKSAPKINACRGAASGGLRAAPLGAECAAAVDAAPRATLKKPDLRLEKF
jgi:hypothetical protein